MPTKIEEPWLGFLAEVDRRLSRQVEVHCLGGFALAVLWGLPRPTGDVDFIECEPSGAAAELLDIAGEDSELAARYQIHFHQASVAEYPEGYSSRLLDVTPRGTARLRVKALDAHDIALSKLGRNSPRDRSDIEFLVERGAIDATVLAERFERELRPYALNEDRSRSTLELWIDEFF